MIIGHERIISVIYRSYTNYFMNMLYCGKMQAPDNRTLEFIAIYVTSSISLHHTTTPNTTPMMLFHT